MSLAHTVALLGGRSGSDWLTRLLNLSTPALLALFVCWLWGSDERPNRAPIGRRTGLAVLVGLLVTWWAVVVFAVAAFDPPASATDQIATALLLRPFGAPLPGLGVGVLLFNVASAWGVVVVIRRFRSAIGSVARPTIVVGVIGVAVAGLFAGFDAPEFGLRSTLLGNLHVVALGILAAEWLGDRSTKATSESAARWQTGLAWIAPGTIGFGEIAFGLIARQYRERSVVADGVVFLSGRLLTPFLWSLCIAVAAGVVASAVWSLCIAVRADRVGRWLRDPLAVAGVLGLAYFVRFYGLVAVAPERTDAGDPFYYHVTANVLAQGRGFPEPLRWVAFQQHNPSALHGPLYPLVLSISSRLGGTAYFDHKMLSLLIGVGVVAATWALARELAGPTVAILAAVFAAVYPNLWMIDGLLYTEGLMAGLVAVCILCAYRWRHRPRWGTAAGIGALIALAALARGEGLLIGPLMVTPWMLSHRAIAWRQRVLHLAIAGAVCLAVLTPWMIRNAMAFETFVPLSTNGNEVMVYANCDSAYHGKFIGFWDFQCQQAVRDEIGELPGDESQVALEWRRRGIDYARDHASELPRVVAARVLRQWELFRPVQNVEFAVIEGRDREAGTLGLLMYYALAGLGVVGAISIRKRLWPVAAQFVAVTITAAVTYGTIRFRAPVEPLLCVLGAIGAVILGKRLIAWTARQPAPGPPDETLPDERTAWVLGGSGGLRLRAGGVWRRAALRTWLALGAVGVLVAIPLKGLYHTTGGTMEEGFMLAFPERLLAGDMPNRDFLHLYGPGGLHVLAVWFSVVGFSLEAERTFGLIQHLAIITALFTLARPWGRLAAGLVAGLSVFLVLTPVGLTAMAWNGGVALLLWSVVFALRAEHTSRRNNLLVAGLLAGLALTYRPDLGLALGIVFGWYVWRNRCWKEVTVGALVGLVPMWVHIAIVGPVTAFEGMFIDPVFKLRAGRELPRPPSWSHLDGSLQAVAELIPPWWGIPALPAEKSLFLWFWAMLAAPVAIIWIARRVGRAGARPDHAATLMAIGLLSLGILPQGLQRPDSAHLAWVTCLSFPMLIVAGYELLEHRRAVRWPRQRLLQLAGAVTAMMLVITPLFTFRYWLLHARVSVGSIQQPFEVERNGRRFYLGEELAADATSRAIRDLDRLMKPGETLIVGPADLRRTWYSDAFLYYLFPDLAPGTQFIEMDPGLANAQDGPLADELRANDWVILTRLWDGWVEPNSSQEYGSDEPNQVIRDEYCVIGDYNDGLVVLYQHCRD